MSSPSSSLSPLTRPQSHGHSRPSSRSSMRASSPNSIPIQDDPVAIRNQMSALKHEIRQKQAHFNTLETLLLRGPRPLPPSPPTPEAQLPSTLQPNKIQRRSSWGALSSYTANGPESHIPLPANGRPGDIREGVPLDFGVANSSLSPKRTNSPTRSMSRIPVSSVGHARALAEDGRVTESSLTTPTGGENSSNELLSAPATPRRESLSPPTSNSTSHRKSLGGGNTTKVLADLQAGVMASRNALDNAKQQLRLSQRTVAQLTRQNEDLKEGRERLRLENEGLNNVVARKERLLQEVLERARKAEAEAQTLKTQLKQETSTAKKAIRDMEMIVSESTTTSAKSEREYIVLRDSIKHMWEGWKSDLAQVKEDMTRKESEWKAESETMAKKYKDLCRLVEEERAEQKNLDEIKEESRKMEKVFEDIFKEQLGFFAERIERSSGDTESAKKTADALAMELARLRRLMQIAGRAPDDTL